MQPVPIQCGAIRPSGWPRHALVSVLVRLAAIAGLAVAGWIALSALNGAASAAEHPARSDARHGPQLGRQALRFLQDRATGLPDGLRDAGDRPDRILRSGTVREVAAVPGPVREIGDDPVRYVQARRHDVFDAKDQAIGDVRDLADVADVPQVRMTDVQRVPIVRGLADEVADPTPVLGGHLPSPNHPTVAADGTPMHGKPARGKPAHGKPAPLDGTATWAGHTAAQPADHAPDRDAGDCPGCAGRHAPVPSHGPEDPGSGPAGGHQLTPVADLRGARYPAAPSAVDSSTFHRTALTDVSAPGGPSVVPD